MIPPTIPFSLVDFGARARTNHLGIEELAESIADSGLILPLILVEKTPELVLEYETLKDCKLDPSKPYLLTAGGRRYCALETLDIELLHHASTSNPGQPGFLLREEPDLLTQLIIEGKENLNREDMDWRDLLRHMVQCFRLARAQGFKQGEELIARDFGTTLGVGYQKLEIGIRIYDHFVQMPELYVDCTSIYQALSAYIKATGNELARVAVTKSFASPSTPRLTEIANPTILESVNAEAGPQRTSRILAPGMSPLMMETVSDNHIPITKSFLNCNGLDFMESQTEPFCDHIVTDPDYAIEADVLNSSPNSRESVDIGIRQDSADASLRDLFRLMPLAFKSMRPHGFFVFWYAIDHHEKLRRAAQAAGFIVQPWPIIWNKMDFRARSNGAPNHNFPKSIEFAMVCRKPGTILAKVQSSAIYTTTAIDVTKILNHPFAKPFEIWRWIFKAISVPSQVVFDPFVGVGSMPIEAINCELLPIGCELHEGLYQNLLLNLQNAYRKLLGPNVQFS